MNIFSCVYSEDEVAISHRPPTPVEFMEVLQKFKLAFNLLARLKSHIHDPNAPGKVPDTWVFLTRRTTNCRPLILLNTKKKEKKSVELFHYVSSQNLNLMIDHAWKNSLRDRLLLLLLSSVFLLIFQVFHSFFSLLFLHFSTFPHLFASASPHIPDLSSPSELIHFLFTPLSLIVEACKSAESKKPEVAMKVVSPLLSGDAVELLDNCLASRESHLWKSMGDAWTTPK